MYVVPYDDLLSNLGLTREDVVDGKSISIPVELFKFLLESVLEKGEFNEERYLKENADIAEAVESGVIEDPRLHYIGNGYYEARPGCGPAFDERWYLKTYPDVAKAVRAGKLKSGFDHYAKAGAREFRSPSEEFVRDTIEWSRVLGKK